jgi:hypothetical protein
MMKKNTIHTTVHLSLEDATRLEDAAKKLGKKRSRLMMQLLYLLMINWKKWHHVFESVKYQSSSGDAWVVKHVFLPVDDYELCTDMRNFFKYSVSGLLAFTIHVYLDKILSGEIELPEELGDNNHLRGYSCRGEMNKNEICWHTKWILSEEFARRVER